jgi:glycosyltransferase involved in cell wall biosynthesis
MNTNDLISVILPVNNNCETLNLCLDSLLSQNYEPIEIIAIDDASTDLSWKILSKFKRQDKRLKIYRNIKKYGLSISLNRAIKRAKGKYIVFMDAKDTVTKNKLQKQYDYLIKNEKVVAVGTQCIYVNKQNKRTGKSSFPALHEHISEKPLHGISVLFEGIMINKYKIPRDLLYFPNKKDLLLYTDMAMKLLQYGELANLDEFLHFHQKNNNYTSLRDTFNHVVSLAKLWTASKAQNTQTPSFRSFFISALRPNSAQ